MTRERDHDDVDEAADFALGLTKLDELRARLWPEGDRLGSPDLGAGACDDCGHESARRWRYGRATLCRSCARLRLRRAAREGVEPPLADPVDELAERARAVIAEARGVDGRPVVTGSATGQEGDPVLPAPQRQPRRFA